MKGDMKMSDSKVCRHPCKNAEHGRICGELMYVCGLTKNGCTAQYYCHEQKEWKPAHQIKCKNFESDKPTENA